MSYRTYSSARNGFTIHWPTEWVTTQTPTGEPRMVQKTPAPTVFSEGRYDAKNEEEAERLEAHHSFKKDFFPVPSDEEIAAQQAEAEKQEIQTLESRLDELKARNPDEEEETEHEVLTGVSTKAEALEAISKAGGDTDFATQTTTVDDIVEEAEKQGFVFEDWP